MDFIASGLAIAFLAAVAQAVTGFGFGLVLVPLFSLIYDPKAVVMISLSLGFLSKLPILWQDRKFVQLPVIAPLTIAALIGNLAGTQALVYADSSFLRLGIGATVVILSTLMLFNRRWHIKREGLATAVVGFVSGTLTGSTSMGGPPVVLFGVNQAWAKESLRANMTAFSTLTFVFSAALLAISGALTPEIMRLDAVLVPGVALGLFSGNFAFRRAPRGLLYRAIILFVIGTGFVGIFGAINGLL
ncbi:MAG: sulfite exporter TauE/SafE family protein [Chloroflexota bacterium]